MNAAIEQRNERIVASDGFALDAYVATPRAPRGALVIAQEIFGVNAHIRSVADGFARDGYVAIAPALFDRLERGTELGYAEADVARGRALKARADPAAALRDLDAARAHVAAHGNVGIVGYCWGGLLAWLAACRVDGFAAAVVYYGGGIGDVIGEAPRCPVLGHFGERDAAIPIAIVDAWRAEHPDDPVHAYDAGHGFNCDQRAAFDAEAAQLARGRTLEFFRRHLG